MSRPELDERWMEYAACAGEPSSTFFPERTGPNVTAQARLICARCPVRRLCLEFALDQWIDFGVWGGMSAQERRNERRRRRTRR